MATQTIYLAGIFHETGEIRSKLGVQGLHVRVDHDGLGGPLAGRKPQHPQTGRQGRHQAASDQNRPGNPRGVSVSAGNASKGRRQRARSVRTRVVTRSIHPYCPSRVPGSSHRRRPREGLTVSVSVQAVESKRRTRSGKVDPCPTTTDGQVAPGTRT